MLYTVRRCYDIELMEWLNAEIFPDESFESPGDGNHYWVARSVDCNIAVGFCSIRPLTVSGGGAFLSRAGVVENARGHGLHRRMITTRCQWARREGFHEALTYCVIDNAYSAINLQHCGFSPYAPSRRWAGPEFLYWRKAL